VRRRVNAHPEIIEAIIDAREDKLINEEQYDNLDNHLDYVRLKVAGLLAILHGRLWVELEDWRLAGMVTDNSVAVRQWAKAQLAAMTESTALATSGRRQREAVAIGTAKVLHEEEIIEDVAKVLCRHTSTHGDRTAGQLRNACSGGKDGRRRYFDTALALALDLGWLVATDGLYGIGDKWRDG
jgi:hypothetical protein